ncbi:MAG: dihydrofolate reductase family protein [Pirellulales bacterium]
MAEVVYYVAASLDGYIATPDGAVDWLAPFHTAGDDHGYAAFLATLGGIVMGRRTYDQVTGFGPWPYAELDCRVVTSRPLSGTPDRLTPVASPAEAVAGWADRRVWLVGGTTLLDGFRAARLVREYHVFVMPVLLGAGVPLFREGPSASLRLMSAECLPSGVVELLYRVADAETPNAMDSRASP